MTGSFGEKSFSKYSLFTDAENVTDTRRGRFRAAIFLQHRHTTFGEIYMHTEGRVFNCGIKTRLQWDEQLRKTF